MLLDIVLVGEVFGVGTLVLDAEGVFGAEESTGVETGVVGGGEPPVDGASLLDGRGSAGLALASDFGVGGGGGGPLLSPGVEGVAKGDAIGIETPGPPFNACEVLGVEFGVDGGAGVNG